MINASKIGPMIGLVGAVLGSLFWLIALGAALKSWWLIIAPIVLSLICIIVAIILYSKVPKKILSIIGLVVLWVVNVNFIFVNALYNEIPETLNGVSTGKAQMSLASINIFLAAALLVGFYLIIKDITTKQ